MSAINDYKDSPNGTSLYLESFLNPVKVVECPYPDNDMTPCIMKSIQYVSDITVPVNDANYFLIWTPQAEGKELKLFASVGPDATPLFLTDISPDEDLGVSFVAKKYVTSLLSVISSTVSGSTFNLSGSMSAVGVDKLPPMTGLTRVNMLSYRRDEKSVVNQIGVEKGIVALQPATGLNDYVIPLRQSGKPTVSYPKFRVERQDTLMTTEGGGWVLFGTALVSGTPLTLWSSNFDATALPAPALGRLNVILAIDLSFSSAQDVTYVLSVVTRTANPATLAQVLTTTTISQTNTNTAAGNTQKVDLNISNFSPVGEVIELKLTATTISASTTISYTGRRYIRWEFPDAANLPASTIIAVTKMSAGQNFNVNGNINYQVIPGPTLIRDLKTRYYPSDPLELEVLEAVLKSGEIRSVYTGEAYMALMTTRYENLASGRFMYMAAPSIRSKLRSLWDRMSPEVQNVLKKVGSTGAKMGINILTRNLGLDQKLADGIYDLGSSKMQTFFESSDCHDRDMEQLVLILEEIKKSDFQIEEINEPCLTSKEVLVTRFPGKYENDDQYLDEMVQLNKSLFDGCDQLVPNMNIGYWCADVEEKAPAVPVDEKKDSLIPGPSRVDILAGKTDPRTAPSTTTFPAISTGDWPSKLVNITVAKKAPTKILIGGVQHPIEYGYKIAAGDATLHIQNTLDIKLDVPFFLGLKRFIIAKGLLSSGDWFVYTDAAFGLGGSSYQLALLMAVLGFKSNAVYSGGISWSDNMPNQPILQPVGSISDKIAVTAAAKRPLVYFSDDMSQEGLFTEAELFTVMYNQATRLLEGSDLLTGLQNTNAPTSGARVTTVMEAMVASNVTSSGTSVVRSNQAPAKSQLANKAKSYDNLAAFEALLSTGNSLMDESKGSDNKQARDLAALWYKQISSNSVTDISKNGYNRQTFIDAWEGKFPVWRVALKAKEKKKKVSNTQKKLLEVQGGMDKAKELAKLKAQARREQQEAIKDDDFNF